MNDMVDNLDDDGEFSLAQIADLDISDVQEMRFESLPAGAYIFEIAKAVMTEGANKETNAKQFIAEFGLKVVEAKAVTGRGADGQPIDKESLIDKTHTEKKYIVPGAKAAEGLGYLRAFLADMGAPSEGRLGGVEGSEPGCMDEAVGVQFPGKIVLRPNRLDPTQKFARLVLDPRKK